jgi:hypothetical protein
MGLKTRRPPKKGTAAAATKKKEEDTKTEATSESGSTLGLENLRCTDEVQSAADKLTDEGIIATCARVRGAEELQQKLDRGEWGPGLAGWIECSGVFGFCCEPTPPAPYLHTHTFTHRTRQHALTHQNSRARRCTATRRTSTCRT